MFERSMSSYGFFNRLIGLNFFVATHEENNPSLCPAVGPSSIIVCTGLWDNVRFDSNEKAGESSTILIIHSSKSKFNQAFEFFKLTDLTDDECVHLSTEQKNKNWWVVVCRDRREWASLRGARVAQLPSDDACKSLFNLYHTWFLASLKWVPSNLLPTGEAT